MDELSSKYVDQFAVEKLINDKLKLVHHAPNKEDGTHDSSFHDFKNLSVLPEGVIESQNGKYIDISFPSSIKTRYEKNNMVKCRCYCLDQSKGDVIFIHGLFEDNIQIYQYFINMLNQQGLNVYLMVLPFHYERTPAESAFSGEYFWSADVHRSALAFKQAVYDLCQLYHYVKKKSGKPVWITGFSMGGGIGLSLVSLTQIDGIFVINPVCNITELMWNSVLFSTIKSDLERNDYTFEDIKELYSLYEPLNITDVKIPPDRVILAKGIYDQINDTRNYDMFNATWKLKHFLSYKAGHLNILRVPKLANDVSKYYFENASG